MTWNWPGTRPRPTLSPRAWSQRSRTPPSRPAGRSTWRRRWPALRARASRCTPWPIRPTRRAWPRLTTPPRCSTRGGSSRCRTSGPSPWWAPAPSRRMAGRRPTAWSRISPAATSPLSAGGRTLAVFACGVDVVYPPEHRHLAAEIAESGAIVSEYPVGTAPEAGNLPARNRIISGLALGTVVVEAGEKSGALITAQRALEQNRDVFAVPGSIFARTSLGTNRLIRDSAAKLVLGADDVLDELRMQFVPQHVEMRQLLPENETESRLIALLSSEPLHIDVLTRQSALPAAEVSSALAIMELKGLVRQVGGMQYVRGT